MLSRNIKFKNFLNKSKSLSVNRSFKILKNDYLKKKLKFELGDLITIKQSQGVNKVSLVATGSMLEMAKRLCEHFPSLGLVSAPSLKPINESQIIELCKVNNLSRSASGYVPTLTD